MKIFIIHNSKGLGGGTKSFFDLINILRTKHEIVACIPKESIDIVNELAILKIDFIEIPYDIPTFPLYSGGPSFFSRTFFMNFMKFGNIKKIGLLLNSYKPDIVIFNTVILSILSIYLDKNIKKICFVRETFVESPLNLFYKFIFDKYFSAICFISKNEMNKIKTNNHLIKAFIPDTFFPFEKKIFDNSNTLNELKLTKDGFIVLFLGGSDPIKGLDLILKAIKIIDEPNIHLLVAGNLSNIGKTFLGLIKTTVNPIQVYKILTLNRLFKKLQEMNKIISLGYQKEIYKYISVSDIVVFPSIKAHQPRPGIEAGLYSKPIVISNFKATHDLFTNGVNALTFKANNPNDLANKIMNLYKNPIYKEQLGLNNLIYTLKFHHYKSVSHKLLGLIEDL